MMERDRSGRRIAAALGVVLMVAAALPAVADEEANDGWSGSIKAGVTNTTGKTDVFSGSFNADLDRDWEKDRLRFKLRTTFATKNEQREVSTNRTVTQREVDESAQTLSGSWKHTVYDNLFVLSRAETGRDVTQDINLRVLASVGPGYRVWEKDKKTQYLDLSAGAGYRREMYRGDTDTLDAADLSVAFDYSDEFFDGRINLDHTGEILMPANDPNAFLARTEISAGVPVVGGWAVSVTNAFEYLNDPADDAQSITTRLTGGLEYHF